MNSLLDFGCQNPSGGLFPRNSLFFSLLAGKLTDADPQHRRHLSADAAQAARNAAYDGMVQRLTNAWRMPQRDWSQPDLSSTPQELMRRHLGTEPDDPDEDDIDDLQARRDQIYENYKNSLDYRIQKTVVGTGPNVVGFGPGVVGPGPSRGGK